MFYIQALCRDGTPKRQLLPVGVYDPLIKWPPLGSYVTDENTGVATIPLPPGNYTITYDGWDNKPLVILEGVHVKEGQVIEIGKETQGVTTPIYVQWHEPESVPEEGWFSRWLTKVCCKLFKYKEIGWKSIGETFYRWTLLSTPWFKVVLHKLDAPNWHPQCHDHPWDFLAIVLGPGYWEKLDPKQKLRNAGQDCGGSVYWRRPLTILYRPAESKHNVVTIPGRPNWSIVIMSNKRRDWGMLDCE